MKFSKTFLNRHRRGFTTIELLVSTALFSAIMLMGLASVSVLINANQKARSLKTAVDNLHFVMDDMSRALRLGSKFYCQQFVDNDIEIDMVPSVNGGVRDCPYASNDNNSGGQYLGFRDKNYETVFYRFNGTCLQKKVTGTAWSGGYADNFTTGYSCITPPEVTINRVRFYVNDTAATSGKQPVIGIVIRGTVGTQASTQTPFNLSTAVSQRIPHYSE